MFALKTPSLGWRSRWIAVVVALVGCRGAESERGTAAPASPHAGIEVRFLIPPGLGLAESWTPALNDWTRGSQGMYELDEFDFAASEDRLVEILAAKQPTLVLLPSRCVNPLVAEGLVALIPETVIDEGIIAWNSMPAPVRRSLGSLGSRPAMVPVTCEVPICCYREDLLEAAGKQIPTTWEEYDALASSLPEWAAGLVAVEPWAEPYRTTTFFSRAISAAKHSAQYSVALNVASGEPLIDSAPFVRALEEVVALRPHLDNDFETLTPDDCLQKLRSGEAAMGIVWETATSVRAPEDGLHPLDEPGDHQTLSEFPLVFAPLPGRGDVYDRETDRWVSPPLEELNQPALCGPGGFTVCVLNSASEQQQAAAWDLWGLLESYQIDGTIERLPGSAVIPPVAAVSSLGVGLSLEHWQPSRQATTTSLQNASLVCELPVYGQQQLRSELSAALALALTKQRPPAEALQQAAKHWSSEIEQIGRLKVLNSYRQRLGLSQRLD